MAFWDLSVLPATNNFSNTFSSMDPHPSQLETTF
jgi:hypothetical protein